MKYSNLSLIEFIKAIKKVMEDNGFEPMTNNVDKTLMVFAKFAQNPVYPLIIEVYYRKINPVVIIKNKLTFQMGILMSTGEISLNDPDKVSKMLWIMEEYANQAPKDIINISNLVKPKYKF